MLAAVGALHGSPAYADPPTVIACSGSLTTISLGTTDATNYYRISQGNIQEWNDANRRWDENICSIKFYSCTFGAAVYGVEGNYVSDVKKHVKHTLSIDRVTGKTEEFWIVRNGESTYFQGDCKKSPDPALNPAPTKF